MTPDEAPVPDVLLREIVESALALTRNFAGHGDAGTPRRSDHDALVGGCAARGVAQAELLSLISYEMTLKVGEIAYLIDGVADLLEVGRTRANAPNDGALTVVLRTPIEMAALVSWMLDPTADPLTRCRRYLVWRFDQQRLLRRFSLSFNAASDIDLAIELEHKEREIVELTEAAGWTCCRSVPQRNGTRSHARLEKLGTDGGYEKMPDLSDLVAEQIQVVGLYTLMSEASHGGRLGTQSVRDEVNNAKADEDGLVYIKMSSFGLHPNLALKIACSAIGVPCVAMSTWYGSDLGDLADKSAVMMKWTG